MLHPCMELQTENSLRRNFVYLSVPVKQYFASGPSVLSGFPAYAKVKYLSVVNHTSQICQEYTALEANTTTVWVQCFVNCQQRKWISHFCVSLIHCLEKFPYTGKLVSLPSISFCCFIIKRNKATDKLESVFGHRSSEHIMRAFMVSNEFPVQKIYSKS